MSRSSRQQRGSPASAGAAVAHASVPLQAQGVDIVATFEESSRCYLSSFHEGTFGVKRIRTLAPFCRKSEALDSMNGSIVRGVVTSDSDEGLVLCPYSCDATIPPPSQPSPSMGKGSCPLPPWGRVREGVALKLNIIRIKWTGHWWPPTGIVPRQTPFHSLRTWIRSRWRCGEVTCVTDAITWFGLLVRRCRAIDVQTKNRDLQGPRPVWTPSWANT